MRPYRLLLASIVCATVAACVGDDPDTTPAPAPDGGAGDSATGGGGDSGGSDGGGGGDAPVLADIDGHVTDVYARPVAGATVRVGTVQANTDTSGHFHLASIPATYDLDVLAPSKSNGKAITSFRDLTTRTPEASVEGVYALMQAPASGTFAPAITLGTGEHLRISQVDSATGYDNAFVAVDPSNTWSGTANWLGATTTKATFWMVKYTSAGGAEDTPTSFLSFTIVHRDVTASQGTDLSAALTAVTSGTVQGTVTDLPAPASSALLRVALKNATDRYGTLAPPKLDVVGAFSLAVPSGATLSTNVVAQAGGNIGPLQETHWVWKANAAANATGITLAFGLPSRAVTPAHDATGVKNDTAFTWSAGSPAGVYRLDIRCGSGATEYVATVYTTKTTAIPADGSALGAPWPTAGSCTWGITLFQKVTSVDAVVVDAGTRNELERPNGPKDGAFVESTGTAFKTP